MKDAVLWRRILNEGFSTKGDAGIDVESLQTEIVTAPIIVDSRQSTSRTINSFLIGPIAVPFPVTWVEHQTEHCGATTMRSGSLFHVQDAPEIASGFRQCVSVEFAFWGKSRVMLVGQSMLTLDADGKMIVGERCCYPMEWVRRGMPLLKAAEGINYLTLRTLTTFELMSCSNVSLAPRPFNPEQVRRAAKRFGDVPGGYRYHVLVVRPPGARSSTPGQEIDAMPRHVCRGHFAEYGPQFGKGLLFGRYAGRFFIPPHLRGDEKNGIVEKDYAVAAPEGRP
jgi:hypothetical protein